MGANRCRYQHVVIDKRDDEAFKEKRAEKAKRTHTGHTRENLVGHRRRDLRTQAFVSRGRTLARAPVRALAHGVIHGKQKESR